MVVDIVPTPVWSVNAPTALIRCNATGKRNFLFFDSACLPSVPFQRPRTPVGLISNKIASRNLAALETGNDERSMAISNSSLSPNIAVQ